jgi:hypothetical protein
VLETDMRILIFLLATLFITGCATPEQRAAQISAEVDDMVRVYGPGCEKLGFKSDTDPWRDCILRLATKTSLERREVMTTNCIGSRGFFHCSTF